MCQGNRKWRLYRKTGAFAFFDCAPGKYSIETETVGGLFEFDLVKKKEKWLFHRNHFSIAELSRNKKDGPDEKYLYLIGRVVELKNDKGNVKGNNDGLVDKTWKLVFLVLQSGSEEVIAVAVFDLKPPSRKWIKYAGGRRQPCAGRGGALSPLSYNVKNKSGSSCSYLCIGQKKSGSVPVIKLWPLIVSGQESSLLGTPPDFRQKFSSVILLRV